MDWDHLRFFLALARAGTLVNAGRQLKVDHTTVSRRIQALEKQLGAPLFTRDGQGQQLTEAGRELLPQVVAMEEAFHAIEQKTSSGQSGVSGVVRIGVPEGLGTQILAQPLARLSSRHPTLTIDLLALPRLVHLSRREADIVISLERPTRDSVVVSKLTDYALYLYGSAHYLTGCQQPIRTLEDLQSQRFVSYVDDLLFSKQLQFLEDLMQPRLLGLRSTSIMAQKMAVKAGAGLAILPAFIAQQETDLCMVLPQQVKFQRTFWISMPSEIRHLERMKLVWDFLKSTVQEQQGLLLPLEGGKTATGTQGF